MIGWLDDLTNWFKEQFERLFSFLVQLVKDAILWLIESVMELGATIIEMIPVPGFLDGLSIANMLGQAGPTVAWLVTTLKLGEGLALIAGAYAFRLLRKLLTLGQW